MRAAEFLRTIKAIGRQRGVNVRFDPRHGKGSHGRLHYGENFTTLKDLSKEIGPGLLSQMLTDLGLNKEDLHG